MLELVAISDDLHNVAGVADCKLRSNLSCSYTAKQLAENINTILEQYGHCGDKWTIGRRSHESYINALKQFRKFALVQRFGGANA